MAACLITGYELGVMGYPTPLPYGVDPMLATHMFLESYEKEAKVRSAQGEYVATDLGRLTHTD